MSGFVQHAVGVALDDVAGGAPCWPTLSATVGENCLARNELGGQPPRCHQPHREPAAECAGDRDAGGKRLERNDRRYWCCSPVRKRPAPG